MKTIVEVIKESKRFEYLMQILFELSLLRNYDIPVCPYANEDGDYKCRETMDNIRSGIKVWLKCANMEMKEVATIDAFEKGCLDHLEHWVSGEIGILANNYAVSVAHRHNPSETDMEKLRTLLILNSSIWHIQNPWSPDLEEEELLEFEIPTGWMERTE